MSLTATRVAWLLLPVMVLVAATVHAQRGRPSGRSSQAEGRELSDTVRRVERRTGGEVLSAERVPFDGRSVHRVKVLDSSGRVRVYMDDPRASRSRAPEVPAPTRGDDD